MDVQSSSQKKITRIHTFESDVAQARMAQGIKTPSVTPLAVAVPKEKEPTNVPSTVTLQKQPVPLPKIAARQMPPTLPVPSTSKVAAVPPTSTKPADTKPYSTITKEIEGIAKAHTPSILTDKTDAYEGDNLSSGTIISDTKRKRFKLFPAMLSAITSWFYNTKEAYEKSRIPLHTVAKAEKRIKTIVKATTQSEQAPKDDFKKVAAHLKTVERKAIHSTLSFKDKESVPAPTWTSADDDTESVTQTPEYTPQKEVMVEVQEPAVQVVDKPEEEYVQPTLEVVEVPAMQYEEIEEEDYLPSAVTVDEVVPLQVYSQPIAEQSPSLPIETPRYAPPRPDKSSFPFYALISVILIASFSGIAFSYYLFAGKGSSVTTLQAPVYEVPKLIQAQGNTSFILTDNRNELLQTLLANLNTADTVTQMYPTITQGGTSKPAPVEAVVAVLAPRAPGSFTRSIKEITFGSTGNAEPFIIIKSTSFDVAFAGMLNWETMMSADLVPLFGETVTETFDPQARTATGTREAFFKDVIASNKNARVLLDENGDDRIVYTFTDQNTILITTNREALAELIGLVN